MVSSFHSALIAMILPVVAWAGGEPPADPRTEPARLPAIRNVLIEENGAKSPASQEVTGDCARFRLDVSTVRAYLRRARRVSEYDYRHQLDWSACYASGRVTFADGRSAQWGIQQFGAGSLVWPDGTTVYLYCRSCRKPPFQ